LLAALLAAVSVIAAGGQPARAATLPPHFEELALMEGLTGPTDVAWAPDGRMFVAEKAGRVRVLNPNGTSALLLDISGHVNTYLDHGLLGMAVDSDFATNHYLYLAYVYEPNPLTPGSTEPRTSRLTRVTVQANNTLENPGSPETVLFGSSSAAPCGEPANDKDCIPANEFHVIGGVISAPDGTLWVGSGDAGRPALFWTFDERSYVGKILHVDRSGKGLPGHPFCPSDTNLTHVCTKVHAAGFRNPFRFTIPPGGRPIVGDVGELTREEVDVLEPGRNYGWPCYEGTLHSAAFASYSECTQLYAKEGHPDGAAMPAYEWGHTSAGGAVIVGPKYLGGGYPDDYDGDVFVGDYSQGFVKRLRFDQNGAVTSVTGFATGWVGVDLELAPDGNLVYVDFTDGSEGTGRVVKVSYDPSNLAPVANATASPTSGPVPLTVQFQGDGSSDPDGDPLTYDWDFGDGSPHSSAANPSHTYASTGDYVARLTVDDGLGRSDTDTVTVSAGNEAPTADISTPADGSSYRDGEPVALSGSGSDPEEGALPGSRLSWHIVLHHNQHVHEFTTLAGSDSTFVPVRDHGADSYYEVTLTAEDSSGLKDTDTTFIYPQTVPLELLSSHSGVSLGYGGGAVQTPFTKLEAIGFRTIVSAPDVLARDGCVHRFDGWSDGGAQVHEFTVPDAAAALSAIYAPDGTPDSSILSPPDGAAYREGETVQLRARATDPEDGELPGSALSWDVRVRHGDHSHVVDHLEGAEASLPIYAHAPGASHEITLTAKDTCGQTASRTVNVSVETPAGPGADDGPVLAFSSRGAARDAARGLLQGNADDSDGVGSVDVALRLGGRAASARPGGCRWWSRRLRRFRNTKGRCDAPAWIPTRLRPPGGQRVAWRVRLGAPLPPGRYLAYFRALDGQGNIRTRLAGGAARAAFRVRAQRRH
jgi:glucose/arabinose dehydrogenase